VFACKTHGFFVSPPAKTPLRDLSRRQLAHPAWDMRAMLGPLCRQGVLGTAESCSFLINLACTLLAGSVASESLLRDACRF